MNERIQKRSSYEQRRNSLRFVNREGGWYSKWETFSEPFFQDPNRVLWTVIWACIAVLLMWQYAIGMARSKGDMSYYTWMLNNFVVSYQNAFEQGRWWTILTSMFSHKDLIHIGVNMFVLHSFAPVVMSTIGTRQFLALYLFSGTLGALVSMMTNAYREWYHSRNNTQLSGLYGERAPLKNSIGSIGASGAVTGTTVLFAAMYPRAQITMFFFVPMPAAVGIGLYVAYDIYRSYTNRGGRVDAANHVGGAAGGLIWWLLKTRFRVLSAPGLHAGAVGLRLWAGKATATHNMVQKRFTHESTLQQLREDTGVYTPSTRMDPGDLRSLWLTLLFLFGTNLAVYVMWQYAIWLDKKGDPSMLKWMRDHFTVSYHGVIECRRWWTMLTASFSHQDVFDLALNLMWILLLVRPVVEIFGGPMTVLLSIVSGVAGSAAAIIDHELRKRRYSEELGETPAFRRTSISSVFAPQFNASGVAAAITTAFTTMFPLTPVRLLLGLPAWVGVAGIVAIDYYWYSSFGGASGQAASHLGGAVMGVFWGVALRLVLRWAPVASAVVPR
ncbi:hypothetical protein HK105_204581 [Polyrhizophydium stewartii]|uniref:Peptidase S54 rhomboid domain-containing protein n=1 Tax=Polyrhizophydium stewartii TaxID=2732419 RepID=A0ABR4N8M0_9FUNG